MSKPKDEKSNKKGGGLLRRFTVGKMTGAGPRRDKKLLDAERKALGLDKKK
jgi:hypothetical protein